MPVTVAPAAVVGKVRAVDQESQTLHADLRNGTTITVTGEGTRQFSVGDVVLVDGQRNSIVLAPAELWRDDPIIAVVRTKSEEGMVLDVNGKWRHISLDQEIPVEEGNTVEISTEGRILRILSKDPVRYVDFPAIDADAVDRFRVPPENIRETMNDFGGNPGVAARARELIEISLKKRALILESGARPVKGILFSGPPGTGKTMLARIIARESEAAFFEISGPEIFSQWYGQSEALLRRIFESAAEEEAAVIFFDEIDSVAGQRQEGSHEASKRVVAQLLTLMDGFESNNIVVVAATNRPQDIDPALRRPGRFDWEVRFTLPAAAERLDILQKWSRRIKSAGQLPHDSIVAETDGWSGAELAAVWTEAALLAAADGRSRIFPEDFIAGFKRVASNRGEKSESRGA